MAVAADTRSFLDPRIVARCRLVVPLRIARRNSPSGVKKTWLAWGVEYAAWRAKRCLTGGTITSKSCLQTPVAASSSAWDVIALSKQPPICSRRRGRSESHLHRQSKSRLRRSDGMSCQRTCPTPSNISTIENWTCSLQRLSKRLSGAADRYPTFRQIYLINRYGSGRLERTDRPMGRTWKWRRSL
jgi:hypothetical protein